MKKRALLPALALVTLSALAGAAAAQPPERFTGHYVSTDHDRLRETGRVTLQVDHWGTDQEAAAYLQVLKDKGQKGLLADFSDAKEVGHLEFGGLSCEIVFAREIPTPDGRIVRAWTDQPILYFHARYSTRNRDSTRLLDYPFGAIEIRFVGDKKGEGTLNAAVQVGFDDAGQLETEQWDAQPYRMLDVGAEPVAAKM